MLERFTEPPSGKLFDLRALDDLVQAGIDIVKAQLGKDGLEPISSTAGRLLVDQGVVRSVDDGIVVFHERISRDKPGLRRLFRRLDTAAGRLPRPKPRTRAQRAVVAAMRAGEVQRKNGKITGLSPKARTELARIKREDTEARNEKRKRLQSTALAKLQGIGGKRGKPRKRR